MASSDLATYCEKLKTTKSFGYNITEIINVTLNDGRKRNVIYDGSISLDLKPPIIFTDLIKQLNSSLIPGRSIKPYTYSIIELEKLLFLSIFKDDYKTLSKTLINVEGKEIIDRSIDPKSEIGESILSILRKELKQFIFIGKDGKEYICFFRVVGSNFELFNKHGSFTAYLKNILLDNFCDYFDFTTASAYTDRFNQHSYDDEFNHLYFFYGIAGEFILDRVNESTFRVKYNFLSGTLMQTDYNTEERKIIADNTLNVILESLEASNRYILTYENNNLIPNMDKTDDAIALIKEGIKLYYINDDDDEILKIYKKEKEKSFVYFTQANIALRNLLTLTTLHSIPINTKEIATFIRLLDGMKKESYDSKSNISENKRVIDLIRRFMNDNLLTNPLIIADPSLKSIIEINFFNNLEKIKNYYLLEERINGMKRPENIVNEGDLKRTRGVKTGGKRKTKKQRKNKKYSKNKISKKQRKTKKNKEKQRKR